MIDRRRRVENILKVSPKAVDVLMHVSGLGRNHGGRTVRCR